jgi:hypothetical protein
MTWFKRGSWGHEVIIDVLSTNEELEQDIRRLHKLISDAEDLYRDMIDRYDELWGWDVLDDMAGMSLGNPEVLEEILSKLEDI